MIDSLSPLDALAPELQDELSKILEKYLADLEQGVHCDPDALLAQYPHLAEPLRLSLGSLDFLHRAAGGLETGSNVAKSDDLQYRELGDFKIRHEIGRGGMGIVYEAEQISIGRKVALKVLPFAAVLDQKQIARFNNEAQAAGQLNHPHIVPVFSVGCQQGVHYYSMQLIEGQPLDRIISDLRTCSPKGDLKREPLISRSTTKAEDYLDSIDDEDSLDLHEPPASSKEAFRSTMANGSPTSPTDQGFSTDRPVHSRSHIRNAVELAIQAADAIHYAHQCGVIHRDIKPSNLLIDKQGKLWVTDFGLARCQAGNNITMTGDLLGTVRYMSPEQAGGRGHLVDHRSDVYSLGVTLFELLTLQHPFDAKERQALLLQIERDDPLPTRRLNASIPAALETVILKSLSKLREDRYETAQDMADDLRRFLEGKPTLATRPTMLDRATKWVGRHRTTVATAVGILLLTVLGTTSATVMILNEQANTEAALRVAQKNLSQSQVNLHRAMDVVERFGMRLANQLSEVPGMERLQHSLLQETLKDYQGFVKLLPDDPETRLALAFSYMQMGALHGQLGEMEQALQDYQQAEALYDPLTIEQPEEPRFRQDLGVCHNNVGEILFRQGHIQRATEAFDRALALQRPLVATHPATDLYQTALATTLVNQGNLYRAIRDTERAADAYDEAVEIQQRLCNQLPEDAHCQRQLAVSYMQLSFLHAAHQLDLADQFSAKALSIHQRLAAVDKTGLRPLADLATCYDHRGSIFNQSGRRGEAVKAYEKALAVQKRLVLRAPTIVHYREALAVSCNNLGQMLVASLPKSAQRYFWQAKELLETLVQASPQSPRYRAQLGAVLANLGPLYTAEEQDQAESAYKNAIRHQAWALKRAPQIADFRIWLSSSYVKYGRFLRQQKNPQAAAEIALKRRTLWKGVGMRLHRVALELADSATLISETDLKQSRIWADEVVATLKEAAEAGYGNPDNLTREPKFRFLANHDGFRMLLTTLETQPEAALNAAPLKKAPL